ncbi:MAG: c-type cytochrome [Methylosarcina sp.]
MFSSLTHPGVQRIFAACAALYFVLLSAPALAQDDGQWKSGEDIYAKVCGYCHEVGVGPVIKGRQLPAEYISMRVRRGPGAMPAFSVSFIDDKALQNLANYLSQSAAPKK